MAKTTVVDREAIHQLCVRLEARAKSRCLTNRPEVRKDLRLAAACLRAMLAVGVPVSAFEIELGEG
jgi:hypothetical protein